MHASWIAGLDALRANPLRASLSTLGVVMGVAAMVSVLALGDGVEHYAREQVERTTDLQAVTVIAEEFVTVDGVGVRRDSVVQFHSADARALASAVGAAQVGMMTVGAVLGVIEGQETPRGFGLVGVLPEQFSIRGRRVLAGHPFDDRDTAVVVLNAPAAALVAGDSKRPEFAIGQQITWRGRSHRVVAVMAPSVEDRAPQAAVPVDDATRAIGPNRAPTITLVASAVESVPGMKAAAEAWLERRFGPSWAERVRVSTNAARVEQMMTGLLVFKLLMGAITGVSLLVGGIGIMNVLLASVIERTHEIGIRKAAGATHRDILAQFLGESVAITGAGAVIGVVLGLGIAYAAAAIMRAQAGASVYAAITWPTMLFAAAASITIGLAFGLYPALRAARLSPIDAIRHE